MADIDLMDDHHSEDDNDIWAMKDDVPSDATIEQAVMESSNDINEEKSGEEKIPRKRKNECDKLLDSLSKNEKVTEGKKRNTKL